MHEGVFESFSYVTVAVAQDRRAPALVEAAAAFCRSTGKKLCLLHVAEPWAAPPPFDLAGRYASLWDAAPVIDRKAAARAEVFLEDMAARHAQGLVTRRHVVVGKPQELLGRTAVEVGSGLLVVGAEFDPPPFAGAGSATALALMASAPLPVLVLDPDGAAPLPPAGGTILLADDLSSDSEAAVAFAFDLAIAVEDVEVHHLHINAVGTASLNAALAALRATLAPTAAFTGPAALEGLATAEDIQGELEGLMADRLVQRASGYRDYLEAAGGSYSPRVETGAVGAALAGVAQDLSPDLIVFGRHQSLHKRPFYLGRLPLRAMLTLRRPVVVVPNG